MRQTILFGGTLVAAFALALSAQAANLITNGDFEAGYVGFGSDYSVQVPTMDQGKYAIDNNPNDVHPAWAAFGDHTTGSGQMMIVNGSNSTTDRVWYESGIGVSQNTTYYFSTWIRSVYDQSRAELNFSINLNGIGTTFTAGLVADGWQQFYTSWDSDAATFADIALVNQNAAYSGNDFALDDIAFSTTNPGVVPEPTTWALMIIGFGGAGAMLRRRRAIFA